MPKSEAIHFSSSESCIAGF